jgi:hypothetical protein
MESMSRRQQKDIRVIGRFVEVYCHDKHGSTRREKHRLSNGRDSFSLCAECASLAEYAAARRMNCPLEGKKPACKHCHIHCYAPDQRRRIQDIMAYSGKKLLMRGRIDYLWHYYF